MASLTINSVVSPPLTTRPTTGHQSASTSHATPAHCRRSRIARHISAVRPFRHSSRIAKAPSIRSRGIGGLRVSANADATSESERTGGKSAGPAGGRGGAEGRGGSADGEVVDTRIHWNSPDEGWIGGSGFSSEEESDGRWSDGSSDAGLRTAVSRDMQLLIMSTSNNHYSILGLSPLADTDDVKTAYRRLSKRYHPDTTRLPLPLAEQQFVRLNQAYEVLSSPEDRRLYDWKLAQEASEVRGGRFVWPYEVDQTQRGMGSRDPPAAVGRKGSGVDENDVPLSDGSITALAFDAFAVLFAIACIVYAVYFKGH